VTGIVLLAVSFSYLEMRWEWIVVMGFYALWLIAEALNTAIEKLADVVCSEYNSRIEVVKDIAAGAVFIAGIAAIGVWFVIFWPYVQTTP
jgi:diacylglycerol kinase (ATP)